MFRDAGRGETQQMSEREEQTTLQPESIAQFAGRRGDDDRRGRVAPESNPAPVSPAADEEAIHKGEEILERVKPY